jgi:hypothetical protein
LLRVERLSDTTPRMGASFAILALVAIQVAEAPPPRDTPGRIRPGVSEHPEGTGGAMSNETDVAPADGPSHEGPPPGPPPSGEPVPTEARAEARVVKSCAAALGVDACRPFVQDDPETWFARVRFSSSDVGKKNTRAGE